MHKIDDAEPFMEYAIVNVESKRSVKGSPKFIAIILTKLFYKYEKVRMHITADDIIEMGAKNEIQGLLDNKYALLTKPAKSFDEKLAYLMGDIN